MKAVRCRACNAEFTDVEIEGHKACPACGSKRAPIAIAQDVTLTLNWFELRILANWAERWAETLASDHDARGSLELILNRIRACRPAGAPGLTLRDEMGDLHDAGLDASLADSTGKSLVSPPTKH